MAFDYRAHLNTPLICLKETGLDLTIKPTVLIKGEKEFVLKLKDYLVRNVLCFNEDDCINEMMSKILAL